MDLQLSPSRHWRWPAAASPAATAGIHTALVPSHLREAPNAGALFIVLSTAALAIVILLVASNRQLVWLAAAALSLTALLAYVISRSVGLPRLQTTSATYPLGVAAMLSETAAALICWHALLHGSWSSSRRARSSVHRTRVTRQVPEPKWFTKQPGTAATPPGSSGSRHG